MAASVSDGHVAEPLSSPESPPAVARCWSGPLLARSFSSRKSASRPSERLDAPQVPQDPLPSPTRWRYRPPDWVPLGIRSQPQLEWAGGSVFLQPGEVFLASREVPGPCGVTFLELADGRGWVFDKKPGVGLLCIRYRECDAEVSLSTYKLSLPCNCLLDLVKCMCVSDADAYHVGVAVYGREWAFYGGDEGTGVRYLRPGAWAPRLCKTVALGPTPLTELEVNEVVRCLEDEWPSNSYRFLSRNCCHFSEELCRRLRVGPLPDSVLRLDVYASQEVVRIVKDGKEARGRARTATFNSMDFCWGLADYGRKARYRYSGGSPTRRLLSEGSSLGEGSPAVGGSADSGRCGFLWRPLLRPYYCMRGVRTFFRRVRKETSSYPTDMRRVDTH